MTKLFGRPCLSPDEGGAGTEDEDRIEDGGVKTEEPKISIGGTEVSQAALDELINGDAAGSTKVTVQGRTVTLKEIREGWKNQPNSQKLLEEDRARLQNEYEERNKALAEREAAIKQAEEAGGGQLTKVAEALREAMNPRQQDPFRDRDSAVAYVTDLVRDDATGTVAAIVDRMFADRKATDEKLGKLAEELKGLKAESEQKRTQDAVTAQAREIVREIQSLHEKDGDFPLYNPKGKDEFSLLVSELLRSEEKSDILDGAVGIDTEPAKVARMVNVYLDKRADERVAKREEAKKRRERQEAGMPRESGGGRLTDEDRAEIKAAGTDRHKLAAIQRKIAARG